MGCRNLMFLLLIVPPTLPYLSDPMASLFTVLQLPWKSNQSGSWLPPSSRPQFCVSMRDCGNMYFGDFQPTHCISPPYILGHHQDWETLQAWKVLYSDLCMSCFFLCLFLLVFPLLISLSVFIPFSARILFEANSVKPHSNWLSTIDLHNWKV